MITIKPSYKRLIGGESFTWSSCKFLSVRWMLKIWPASSQVHKTMQISKYNCSVQFYNWGKYVVHFYSFSKYKKHVIFWKLFTTGIFPLMKVLIKNNNITCFVWVNIEPSPLVAMDWPGLDRSEREEFHNQIVWMFDLRLLFITCPCHIIYVTYKSCQV